MDYLPKSVDFDDEIRKQGERGGCLGRHVVKSVETAEENIKRTFCCL